MHICVVHWDKQSVLNIGDVVCPRLVVIQWSIICCCQEYWCCSKLLNQLSDLKLSGDTHLLP